MGWEGGCPAHAGPGSAAERVETETRASPGRGLFYPRFYLLSIRAMQTRRIRRQLDARGRLEGACFPLAVVVCLATVHM